MSNDLSIAVVTAALKRIVSAAVTTGTITVRPLDRARRDEGNQINLFLYHAILSGAWRNHPPVGNGGSSHPPLPLTLYYLITAYGTEDNDVVAHRILGRAMSLLHDHPILTGADIAAGIDDERLDDEDDQPDLAHQIEHIRITWHPLSLEELSRLWGGMQTALRLSVAYEVTVVLMESRRPAVTPLPVLRRGREVEGVPVSASLQSPVPALDHIELPSGQPVAQDGDTLILTGSRLRRRAGDAVSVRFDYPRFNILNRLPADTATESEVQVMLPDDAPERWPVGGYTVAVETAAEGPEPGETETRTTNALSMAIGPRVLAMTFDPVAPAVGDDVTVTISFRPRLRDGQRARLLYDGAEVAPEPFTPPVDALRFVLSQVRRGKIPLRLRIDGIESRLIPNRAAHPPVYDAAHLLTVD